MQLSWGIAAVLCALLWPGSCFAASPAGPGSHPSGRPAVGHKNTEWRISPSFKYDVLCLLNVLSGDEFYLEYYKQDYAELSPRLSPAARLALADLKRKVKDEHKNIISAFLTLYFSATEDETLDDMLRTLNDSRGMQRNLRKSPYYSQEGWRLYESVRGDLRVILLSLKESGFERYWKEKILPRVRQQIQRIEPSLPNYNVVAEVERLLGFPLPSRKITVYMLYYSQPHGIKILGTRFLTDVAWPFRIVLRNAVHEMMHPPFDPRRDGELRAALHQLKADSFLMDKVKNHNPAFGYNSFDGFMEEDCVQALEQLIAEKWNVADDARTRWKQNDDGMHVFAVALYLAMKADHYEAQGISLRDFLIQRIRSGRFSPGRIEAAVAEFHH